MTSVKSTKVNATRNSPANIRLAAMITDGFVLLARLTKMVSPFKVVVVQL